MFFFFKQKTAYEMRISDWSSDVCSSDLGEVTHRDQVYPGEHQAIVPEALWDAVQTRLACNAIARKRQTNAREPSLLAGRISDGEGRRKDRQSVVGGKSVSVRGDPGGRRIIKKKTRIAESITQENT